MFEIDDDDFVPASSSNLSCLFNTKMSSEDLNSNLTYKAPKQPKAEDNVDAAPKEGSQSLVIMTKVITLWKLEAGQNKLMGRHIVAIIGLPTRNIFELILYQDKNKIVIRRLLNESLIIYKYQKKFTGLYDNENQFWNLNFDTLENRESFLSEINKYNCQIIDNSSQDNFHDQVENKEKVESNTMEVNSTRKDSIDNSELKFKSSILSRITKMGQQILPENVMHITTSTEFSDSETDESLSDTKSKKPVTIPRKLKRNQNLYNEKALVSAKADEGNAMVSPMLPNTYSSQILSNIHNQRILNQPGMVYSQPFPDYGINNFIIAQNTELKANLAELNSKLSNVLSLRGEGLGTNGNNEETSFLKSKIKCLNLKIENVYSDLEISRKHCEKLRKQYEGKCNNLLEETRKNENMKDLIILRERVQNVLLKEEEIEHLKTELKKKDTLIESQKLKLIDFENYYEDNKNAKEQLLKEINTLKETIADMELKIKEYEKIYKDEENRSEIKNIKGEIIDNNIERIVKKEMNEAFQSIMGSFADNGNYCSKEIQEVILKKLKKTTFNLIDTLKM